MKLFFEIKAQEAGQDVDQIIPVQLFLPNRFNQSSNNVENVDNLNTNRTSTPETVNEIMVKVEMKRLNNLIANRDPLRNTLLKADKHRVYPLNKFSTNS